MYTGNAHTNKNIMSSLILFPSLGDQDGSPLVENICIYTDIYNTNPSLLSLLSSWHLCPWSPQLLAPAQTEAWHPQPHSNRWYSNLLSDRYPYTHIYTHYGSPSKWPWILRLPNSWPLGPPACLVPHAQAHAHKQTGLSGSRSRPTVSPAPDLQTPWSLWQLACSPWSLQQPALSPSCLSSIHPTASSLSDTWLPRSDKCTDQQPLYTQPVPSSKSGRGTPWRARSTCDLVKTRLTT